MVIQMVQSRKVMARVLWLALMLASSPLWAAVSASLSSNPVYEGDTVVLDIETDGQVSAEPDLSGLKADFDILSNSQSHQVSIINGRRSEKRGWKVVLKPKRVGRLSVPAISVGGEKTRPLKLEVKPIPPEVAKRMAEHLFVETELEPVGHGPYVQQQLRLRVRLYYDIDLLEGELSNPAPNGDVVLERLGEDRRYTDVRAGKRYHVIERTYALFPERSGVLKIPSVTFEGRAASRGNRRRASRGRSWMEQFLNGRGIPDVFANDPFFNRDPFSDGFFAGAPLGDPGRRVSAHSKPMTLKVKPRPKTYRGKHWLPAEDLKLTDSWAQNPPQFRVGEPVTRTLVIEAKGLESSQLPQIEIPPMPGMEVYPEQPLNNDQVVGDWVVGRSEQTFAFVPSKAGRQVIPGIRLRWWDVNADKAREAVLPRWEIEVKPGVAGAVSSPPKVNKKVPGSAAAVQENKAASAPVAVEHRPWYRNRGWWAWLVLTGALLAAVLAWKWRPAGREEAAAEEGADIPPGSRQEAVRTAALETLRKACADRDPRAAAHALLTLGRIEWADDPPLDLSQLAVRLAKGQDEIADLNHALFASHEGGTWDGTALCERFGKGLAPLKVQSSPAGASAAPLPPLYPQHVGRV